MDMDAMPSILFPVPELVARRARVPGKVSVRDWAEVRLGPGLLGFLMTARGTGEAPPGRGTHPMTGVPLGVGIEAAIQAASGKENGIDVLRACEWVFESPVEAGDVLRGRGEVVSLGTRCIRAHVEVFGESADGREPGSRLLLKGEVILVRVVDGRAVCLDSLVHFE